LTDDQAARLAQAEWDATRQAGDLRGLLARLDQTRATGFAEDTDDHTDGISAIGIAFRDLAGDTFAISVPIPTSRFAEQRSAVIAAVLRVQSDLAQVMAS
jgi:DNA-binding IclR family transcriptional regulator